jgi:hypothetical protein
MMESYERWVARERVMVVFMALVRPFGRAKPFG